MAQHRMLGAGAHQHSGEGLHNARPLIHCGSRCSCTAPPRRILPPTQDQGHDSAALSAGTLSINSSKTPPCHDQQAPPLTAWHFLRSHQQGSANNPPPTSSQQQQTPTTLNNNRALPAATPHKNTLGFPPSSSEPSSAWPFLQHHYVTVSKHDSLPSGSRSVGQSAASRHSLSTRNFTRYLPGRSSRVPSNLQEGKTAWCQHSARFVHIQACIHRYTKHPSS